MRKIILLIMFFPFYVSAWNLQGVGSYQFEKIASNVYVMHGPLDFPNKKNKGFMNNPGLVIGSKGLILIDPGSTYQVGKKVLEEVKKVTHLPVVAVFNTHIHGDHWLANHAVHEAYPKATIYGHAEMIKQAKGGEAAVWIDMMSRLTEGASKGTRPVLPDRVSKHQDSYTIAGQHFVIHALTVAHTNTDIMIEHVESKTLFMGDNGFNGRMGRFDNSSSMYGNIETLQYLKTKGFKVFVPGHGLSGSYQKAVQPFLDYLIKVQQLVKAGFAKGLENYEIKSAAVKALQAYKGWVDFDSMLGKHVAKMYLEVEAHDL